MFDKDGPQAKMGRAGETIVQNWLNKNGFVVEASVDQYDSEKDMLVEGKKIEVKTQVPFIMKDAFSILQKQLNKCLKADFVYFVSVPNSTKKHYSDGKVYRIESNKIKYQFHKTKDGRQMILIPIKQPDMKEVFQMTTKECEILQRYSVSKWN